MKTGRIIGMIVGSILALIALGALFAGGALLWAHETLRDEGGFFNSPSYHLEAAGAAIVADGIDLASHPGDWWPSRVEATARLDVQASTGSAIFVGIGSQEDVDSYLQGVAHSVVRRLGDRWNDVRLEEEPGSSPALAPADAGIWAASMQGEGEQTLTWDLQPGKWAVVMMNADGSEPVSVTAIAAMRIPVLYPISIGLLAAGVLLAAIAALLLVAATRSVRPAELSPAAGSIQGRYPITVTGTLDEPLSPVLWLIKWFLLIPHYFVLAVLWGAFVVLTVIAWLAILFTARYPKGIFDFNVGVLRWSWRVAYYGYSTLGTDRYPPFTLRDVAYPARLDVAYPERLSRGLALVKWWLLAIPHYIIVGLFTSGIWTWTFGSHAPDHAAMRAGGGLIFILAVIAGFVLLFTGRYPRGLFDLLMGLNRWALRVGAYVALMHDDYPPFALDMGGEEAGGDAPED